MPEDIYSRPNYIARMIVIYSAKFKQECFCCLGVEKLKRSNKEWKRERSTYHNDSTRICRFCERLLYVNYAMSSFRAVENVLVV